ncbi:ribonucleoside-diphosphate reductase, adenosylcobalamin-dependent [bacterium CG17_big_fil_post_rev_8_21_14_2_50_64_8]|nr:MAG: ribonucleoside-diphosphate reductase, adenosylcobalamin-dependent [bacterium CG17_big_fil_post_rev_8_21_14_2_50_64_8]PJA74068.1 MAG: ribonucleoside-diphosphate reductase, adenosylcobalamin-dependent [bacterium CG_4_9_14_3_um_filter_65_15]
MTDKINKEKLQPAGDGVLFGETGTPALDSKRICREVETPAAGSATLAGAETETEAEIRSKGLAVPRWFTTAGVDPFDAIEWELRTAAITNDKGEVIFKQENCEIPSSWSPMAANVVVSKYFRGGVGTPERETSVRQLIGRVADTITDWGVKDRFFATDEDGAIFRAELKHMLVNQLAAFNSPVWFNVGVEKKPQCSACFINAVEDSMASILDLAKTEGLLFKYGSGTGSNLSALRSSRENLSAGGQASGPVSFMRGFDAFAGVIKSGGKTRRAAKMVILDAGHPDIEEFIDCKVKEEKKAWALMDQGYDGSFNGEAYSSIFFQNSNNSVRVTNEFMRAVEEDGEWTTHAVVDGRPMDTYRARDLMRKIAEGTHVCGDPGMQFDTTINHWHTCKNTDRIKASNPCSEYMFLDNSACNLASLNLMKFRDGKGEFDTASFRYAVRLLIMAMEIIVGNSSYPRPEIEANSHRFRPLGLGFANLGALLMYRGLPYDSNTGRDYAAGITALMCGEAYKASAEIAGRIGPFAGFPENREPMLEVIRQHRAALNNINRNRVPENLLEEAENAWREAYALGHDFGYRHSQVTVLAPTGTIGFMMDCDTTGVEPDIALIKYKKTVDGGLMKIVNHTVPDALERLGYDEEQIGDIIDYISHQETIEGAPHLKEEHLPVFDCAFRPAKGERSIHYMGHLRMMAAVQPFLSGAISKTVNLPPEATVEEISQTYLEAWQMGLKAVAIYRDGSKRLQPLNTGAKEEKADESQLAPPKPKRVRLPDERKALTHKFSISGHEGYLTVGMYPNGKPGEMFISMAKEGSVVSGLMDSFATSVSIMLQYGVPLKVLVNKFSHARFEPSGFTSNKEIPIAKSVMDYIFRWMDLKFGDHLGDADGTEEDGVADTTEAALAKNEAAGLKAMVAAAGSERSRITLDEREHTVFQQQADSPPCPECGSVTVRNGSCYKCHNCGATTGCS